MTVPELAGAASAVTTATRVGSTARASTIGFDRLRIREQSAGLGRLPECVVGVVDDGVLEAALDELALAGVGARHVRHRFREADRETDVHSVRRVADRWTAGLARRGLPPRLVDRVELPGLAHVVAQRAGDEKVTVDGKRRKLLLQLVP